MGEEIKVSIILPVYNSEKYLPELFEDIIRQSYTDFEVIIVNDGSKDNSQHIIDEYAKRDKRFRTIEISGSGVSQARNLGISMARGKYIRFVDADDRLPTDSMKYMMDIAEQDESIDLVIGSFCSVPESNFYYGEYATKGKQTLEQMSTDLLFNIKSFYYGVMWNKLYKRDIINRNYIKCSENISWCEDYLFNLEYYKHCKWVFIMPPNKKIYKYYQHASSATKNVREMPKEKVEKICSMRIEQTRNFFAGMGLEEKLELEWQYSFLFSDLFDIAKEKETRLCDKYQKIKKSLTQDGVDEYIKLKKEYFSDISFYHFTFWCAKRRWYAPVLIYVCICGWLAKHFNWIKYLWMKIGGKRPKIL